VTATLKPALDAERQTIASPAGKLTCYVAGEGERLLLIHSINATASAYEIKPLFDGLREHFHVIAPDLPGFGLSERSDRSYDIESYVSAIDAVRDEIAAPCHALAVSLSSEFLARSASRSPQGYRTLALVTPTGFDARSDRLRETEGSTRENLVGRFFTSTPGLSPLMYSLLTRPRVIRYFLKRTFGSNAFPDELAEYGAASAAQPNARYAPFAFLSGRLFAKDIRTVYESLDMPVWLSNGTRGDFSDFRGADWIENRSNWQHSVYPTGAMPYFEKGNTFLNDYRRFIDAHPSM